VSSVKKLQLNSLHLFTFQHFYKHGKTSLPYKTRGLSGAMPWSLAFYLKHAYSLSQILSYRMTKVTTITSRHMFRRLISPSSGDTHSEDLRASVWFITGVLSKIFHVATFGSTGSSNSIYIKTRHPHWIKCLKYMFFPVWVMCFYIYAVTGTSAPANGIVNYLAQDSCYKPY
jgi:hypothetical protein